MHHFRGARAVAVIEQSGPYLHLVTESCPGAGLSVGGALSCCIHHCRSGSGPLSLWWSIGWVGRGTLGCPYSAEEHPGGRGQAGDRASDTERPAAVITGAGARGQDRQPGRRHHRRPGALPEPGADQHARVHRQAAGQRAGREHHGARHEQPPPSQTDSAQVRPHLREPRVDRDPQRCHVLAGLAEHHPALDAGQQPRGQHAGLGVRAQLPALAHPLQRVGQ